MIKTFAGELSLNRLDLFVISSCLNMCVLISTSTASVFDRSNYLKSNFSV